MVKALTPPARCRRSWRPAWGYLKAADGGEFLIDFSLLTASSVLFDAVYVPGGARSVAARWPPSAMPSSS